LRLPIWVVDGRGARWCELSAAISRSVANLNLLFRGRH
jgi:hypothetical protein